MIKVTVESVDITQREGMTKNGKPFPKEQTVYYHLFDRDGKPEPHPVKGKITLWNGDDALKVGTYILAPQSIRMGRFGQPELAPKLVPATASGRGGA